MTAPARIPPEAVTRYLPIVAALCPASSPEEAELRARLMLIRDTANQVQRDSSWEAGQALYAIESVAAAHALTPMSIEMLSEMRIALLRLSRAARDLEGVFGHAS